MNAFWIRIFLVTVALTTVLLSGCAHKTLVTTSKAGADVYVEGEHIGKTPVEYVETSTHSGEVHFDVRQNGVSKRFAVSREKFDSSAMLLAIGSGVGAIGVGTLGFLGTSFVLIASVAVIQVNIEAGLALTLLTLPLMSLSAVALSSSILLPILVMGEMGRALPDRLDVNWRTGDVVSESPSAVRPLVGVAPGFVPLMRSSDGEE